MTSQDHLLFVYNADSGLFNSLADIGHKVFSPQTYACQLCAITHGWFQERGEWRDFIRALDAHCEFLHRDQLRRRFPRLNADLPAVLKVTAAGPQICLDARTLNGCRSMSDLQTLIRTRCLGPG